jgi:hypothetical protein
MPGVTTILWRRLDLPGHDACRLTEGDEGWTLEGTAVFHDESPARLSYRVEGGPDWRTRCGLVRGWIGSRSVRVEIRRGEDGGWSLDGNPIAIVEDPADLTDLDLGFTPATNLVPIRRLALEVGDASEAPAAWLDAKTGRVELLVQRYERRSESTYWYEAPSAGYAELLEVDACGFVRSYPRLWTAVP